MTIADIKQTTQGKMDQSIASFKHNLTKIRTGRASPALLDTIHVEHYGNHVPLSQVANVSLLDAPHHQRAAVGKRHGRKDRKGHPRKRPGPEPRQHGRSDPRADAADERRAPQGDDQDRPLRRRERQNRHPQPAPRRQRQHQASGQGQGSDRGRPEALRDPKSRKATDKHIAEIDALVVSKEKDIMEV